MLFKRVGSAIEQVRWKPVTWPFPRRRFSANPLCHPKKDKKMLDRFYLIVDSAEWLERLLPLGVKTVQLRMKDKSHAELTHEILLSKTLCTQHGATLIVNDYWQIALDEGCDFVHLGQEDMDSADFAALRAGGVRIGLSTHTPEELERALGFDPDYIALGPIYPTVLKQMTFPPQGLDRIGEWKRMIGDIPLVAIGGLTPERAKLALAAGADSACVVTDILRHADPEARTREWIEDVSSGS
jgi:thiamine-phosphate pyrophosphorylase